MMNLEQIRNIMIAKVETMKPEHRALVEDDVRNLPISWHNRANSLGACTTKKGYDEHGNFRVIGVKFEFNKLFFEVTKEEYLIDVIYHELMHLLTNKEYNEYCNHDKRFKANCKLYGCNGKSTATAEQCENYNNARSANYKYIVYCENCGLVLEKKQRMSKANIKHLENEVAYVCPECGHQHVKVWQR